MSPFHTLSLNDCLGIQAVDRNYYVNKFAIGVGGNWSAAGTWSTTSGGAANTTVPTAADDVFLDANSGAVTVDANSLAKSVTCTGYTNTLTHNAFSLTISGSLTLVSGMTYTPLATSSLVFNATGTLTTGGKLLPLVSHTSGSLTLGDNVTHMASKVMTFTLSGTALVLNGKTLSGNSSINRLLVQSGTIGTGAQITVGTGTFANADFMDITFSSASDVNLSAITGLSGDCGGNTLTGGGSTLTFTNSTTQTATMSVSKNWSDVTIWTSRVPLPQDDVALSGVTGGTLSSDTPRLGRNINWTGATGSPVWSVNTIANTLVFGSVTLIAGMTTSGGNILYLSGRSNYTITCAGNTFGFAVGMNAPNGTVTQSDAFTLTGSLNLINGTWTTNNFNVTFSACNNGTTGTKTINFGTSTVTMTRNTAGIVWDPGSGTVTVNAASATFVISAVSTGSRTFTGRGFIYGTLTYTVAGSTGTLLLQNSNTFGTINFSDITNARTLQFTAATTTTITNAFNVFGTAGKLMSIQSATASTHTLSKAAGTISGDYLSITNSIATGGAAWYAGVNSTSVSGNTGWIFTAPVAATAVLSGTITSATESNIVAGGKTVILTLTNDTWLGSGTSFDAQRQAIINGLVSAQSETHGWNAEVKAKIPVTDVVRTDNTNVTITLDAEAAYDITVNETVTATVPQSALFYAYNAPVASPTFTITPVVVSSGVGDNVSGVYTARALEKIQYQLILTSTLTSLHDLRQLYYASKGFSARYDRENIRAFLASKTGLSVTTTINDLWRAYAISRGVANRVSLNDMLKELFNTDGLA